MGPQRSLLIRQSADETGEERGIGHGVNNGRPGRENPVLHSKVGNVRLDVIHRPIPAVDGAVVQPQLVQPRHSTRIQYGQRIVAADRKQRREVPEFSSNRSKIEVIQRPEPHPRPHTLSLQLLRTGVGALLEQGDAGLGQKRFAEQERRVRANGDLYAGDRLGSVPVPRKVVGADLEVPLGRRAGSLGMIVSEYICNRSTPSIMISKSSPRAVTICSSRARRGF